MDMQERVQNVIVPVGGKDRKLWTHIITNAYGRPGLRPSELCETSALIVPQCFPQAGTMHRQMQLEVRKAQGLYAPTSCWEWIPVGWL